MAVPDIGVDLQLGSSMTNVLDDVHHPAGISYTWGRRAEGSKTDPAAASLVLLNPDGEYSGRNPLSPNFGRLGRNTPLRLTHGGANVALVVPPDSIGRASTPDAAALDITGDIDVRADLTPTQWGGTTASTGWEVMGKWGIIGQQSWYLRMQDSGRIAFAWSTNGVTGTVLGSDAEVPFAPGERGAIRVTLDVSNGLGGYTITYYTAPTIAGPWTQLGTPDITTAGGATSIFNSTADLQVGDIGALAFEPIAREYHAIEVRNGIAGSVVANPDFTAQASGTTSFSDAAGRSWSAATGLITSRRVRAVLEAADMTPQWTNAYDVKTPITGAGILRRLGRGAKPLASTLRRSLPTLGTSGPVAYWPMEDGSDATRAASAIVGVQPLRVNDFDFAADNSCAGASSLPTIGAAATMHASIPPYTSSTNAYLLAMMYSLDALPASKSALLSIQTTGTARGVVVSFTSTQIVCDVYSTAGALLTSQAFTPAAAVGEGVWRRFELVASYDGANIDFSVGVVDEFGLRDVMLFSVAGTPGTITDIDTGFGALLSGMALGHLVIFPEADPTEWFDADIGYSGEEAGARLLRLCAEEGIPVSIADGPGLHTRLGPQRPAKLLDLFDEIETADGGILVEDRTRLGLTFRTRASMYSQAPRVTIPYEYLVAPLEQTDDDRYTRNDRTAQRVNGSSARAVLTTGALSTAAPPNGVGVYDDSTSVNVYEDEQLPDIASWLLHRGTWDEARYPKVRILLHKYPALVPAVSSLRPGDVIRITDLPVWLPPGPVDLMVEGGDEQYKQFEWVITLSCSPAGPWNVGVLDDATLGRLDTAGSSLVSGVTSTATSLSVATASGPIWTTAGADLPFDILVGGEVMTVTAVSGASSPQTFTVTRSVNGIVKAHLAAADVRLAQPLILAL
ncbi:hypothetical protein [Streptomyces erythrochromogenes]|uniref:hypothetical protein n=1 Tax=Streptomyces erythrochromogenes TaxID=285574 RepID=UPI00225AE0B3|nr:hypothetical protein [Streptomyces erythrochromogenes]MCX5587538.1 hypothetical protein [Streptomyces erythrochromogenes]